MCLPFDFCGLCNFIRNAFAFIVVIFVFGYIGKGLMDFYGQPNINVAQELLDPNFWIPDWTFWVMGFSFTAILFGFCFSIKYITTCLGKFIFALMCGQRKEDEDELYLERV
jgi:hypothetical protein